MRSFIFTVQNIYVQYLFQKKRFNLIDIFTVQSSTVHINILYYYYYKKKVPGLVVQHWNPATGVQELCDGWRLYTVVQASTELAEEFLWPHYKAALLLLGE